MELNKDLDLNELGQGAIDAEPINNISTTAQLPTPEEVIQIELPSGLKITLGSKVYSVIHLINFALELKTELEKSNGKKEVGSIIG